MTNRGLKHYTTNGVHIHYAKWGVQIHYMTHGGSNTQYGKHVFKTLYDKKVQNTTRLTLL